DREAEALRIQLEELRSQRDADRQAHEQALIALRDEREAARVASPAFAPAGTAPSGGGAEAELSEVRSQLALVEASRSVLIDTLKIAQKQVQDLTLELNESVSEQRRVRTM